MAKQPKAAKGDSPPEGWQRWKVYRKGEYVGSATGMPEEVRRRYAEFYKCPAECVELRPKSA